MSEQLNKDIYFATPVYWMDKPEWIKPLIKSTNPYIQKAKKNNQAFIKERYKKTKDKSDHGVVHHSTTLINKSEFKTFQDFIAMTSGNILDDQGYALKEYELFITEMWVQEFAKAGGGHQRLHTHWNGHMSGFYFLKANPETTSQPMFYDPRPGKSQIDLPLKDGSKVTEASPNIQFIAKPGRLIFFNSFLPHLYTVDNGYEPFRFIHFNCQVFPKDILRKGQ
tara:strand:+ start:760 stop:1428 length:669 start_codon:yes stop_codon:yes gene_type:complete